MKVVMQLTSKLPHGHRHCQSRDMVAPWTAQLVRVVVLITAIITTNAACFGWPTIVVRPVQPSFRLRSSGDDDDECGGATAHCRHRHSDAIVVSSWWWSSPNYLSRRRPRCHDGFAMPRLPACLSTTSSLAHHDDDDMNSSRNSNNNNKNNHETDQHVGVDAYQMLRSKQPQAPQQQQQHPTYAAHLPWYKPTMPELYPRRRHFLLQGGAAAVAATIGGLFGGWQLPVSSSWASGPDVAGSGHDRVDASAARVAPFSSSSSSSNDNNDGLFRVYRIIPDDLATLNPSLEPLSDPFAFLQTVTDSPNQSAALWLGEHHNALKDHNAQIRILQQLHNRVTGTTNPAMATTMIGTAQRMLAVGLEQVQRQFQPVLDDYIEGHISLEQMRQGVEWDQRWMWPFEVYQAVFETAQQLRMPLVALNVNSEDLALVERGGLPGMPRSKLREYIRDGTGFAQFATTRSFSAYVDYVIRPSYNLHERMGLLQTTISGERLETPMSFVNFLSGRILWDETMASTAHAWLEQHPPGSILIGLVGADHVKFRQGIPGRFARMATSHAAMATTTTTSSSTAQSPAPPPMMNCISVLLNPTLVDTRPPGSIAASNVAAFSSSDPKALTLQLRYFKDGVDVMSIKDRTLSSSTGGVLPLADYLLISEV